MNAAFFDAVRTSVFGGSLSQGQVDGINKIVSAWEALGDGDNRKLAYILATAYHETAHTMQPVRETLAHSDAKAKEILTKAWKSGKLPWVKSNYWSGGFFGRGYVQLTHEANYRKAGQKLGVDLARQPSLALDPDIAAKVLVRGMMEGWFTGKKLSDYVTADASRFVSARRIVNGTDRAEMIAGYAEAFSDALRTAPKDYAPPEAPVSREKAKRKPTAERNAIAVVLAGLAAAIAAFAKSQGWF